MGDVFARNQDFIYPIYHGRPSLRHKRQLPEPKGQEILPHTSPRNGLLQRPAEVVGIDEYHVNCMLQRSLLQKSLQSLVFARMQRLKIDIDKRQRNTR